MNCYLSIAIHILKKCRKGSPIAQKFRNILMEKPRKSSEGASTNLNKCHNLQLFLHPHAFSESYS